MFQNPCFQDTFASVVSLDDGIVVYITPSIANILGFPKDMLVGRSFIDFIHPKDRMAFASHITCGMSFPMPVTEQHSPQGSNASAGTYFNEHEKLISYVLLIFVYLN